MTMGRPRVSYERYLSSAHWSRVRARTLRLFDNRCAVCGVSTVPLEAHHCRYDHRWHERIGDVIPLCRACHELATERQEERKLYGDLELVNPPKRDPWRVPYIPQQVQR